METFDPSLLFKTNATIGAFLFGAWIAFRFLERWMDKRFGNGNGNGHSPVFTAADRQDLRDLVQSSMRIAQALERHEDESRPILYTLPQWMRDQGERAIEALKMLGEIRMAQRVDSERRDRDGC